ncbi:MAG: GAF domain-containing sensor histidine kinase [Candidatus Binatia bacterium]
MIRRGDPGPIVAKPVPERHQNSAVQSGPSALPSVQDGALDAATTRLLIERSRVGLGITLGALMVLWATDVSLDPEIVTALTLITLFQAVCVAAGFAALPLVRTRRAAAAVPILVLTGIFAAGVWSDVVSDNPQGTGLSALVTCMISATLMPWGVWFQTAMVVATAIPGALSVWLCTGSLASLGYAVGPGSIVLLASISVAHAFERARRERARVEAELRVLQSVSLEVGAAADPESALTIVLRRICEASGWLVGQAWTPAPNGEILACAAWWSGDATLAAFHAENRVFTFARGVGLPGRVWATGQPAWIEDVQHEPNFPRAALAQRAALSGAMALPVLADGDVIAVLEFFVRERHAEDDRLMDLFAGAAMQLGAVIQRKRAERLAEEEAQTSAALVEVGQALSTHLGQPDMLERVTGLAVAALGCDWSATFLWDDAVGTLRLVASSGIQDAMRAALAARPISGDGFALTGPVHSGRVAEIPDVRRASDAPPLLRQIEAASALHAPICLAGALMGVQVHGYRTKTGPFASKQRRLASGVADATAIAIANARLIDDLQASSRLKSEFVATMSHELRTPLNIIVGYSDMLAEGVVGALTKEQQDTVGRVQRAGIELLDLVNATLDAGRLEAGRDPVVRSEVDLDGVFRQLEIELGPLVSPEVTLRWQNLLGASPLVTDKGKLKTVLKNLTGNALKFTTRGSVDVVAHWEGDAVVFEVRDTGIGIPPDSLPVIFEMFRQADGSSTRTFGGVGLGLHIVQRLVTLLGGQVSVESTLGAGSTFVATWPASESVGSRRSVA